ncbi:MAG: type II toxin-antitoxin system prevent-host-death family antitoxin [Pseudomonadota bacterium]
MIQVNLYEAKTSLSKLVDEAASGKEIIIAKNGKPLARLSAVGDVRKPPKLGMLSGRGVSLPSDFDEPLSVEEATLSKPL